MFMVPSSWRSHRESSLSFFDEFSLSAPGDHRPLDQTNQLEPKIHLNWQLYSVLREKKTHSSFFHISMQKRYSIVRPLFKNVLTNSWLHKHC